MLRVVTIMLTIVFHERIVSYKIARSRWFVVARFVDVVMGGDGLQLQYSGVGGAG